MRSPRRAKLAALPLGLALLAMPVAAATSTVDDPAAPSAVAFLPGALSAEASGIRKTLEAYIRAVEAKDLQMFRAIKPNLSDEEEKRARAAFKSIQTQVVKINVLSVDLKDGKATVKVARRDTINGSIVSSFPQTFQLAKQDAGWMIQDIGR